MKLPNLLNKRNLSKEQMYIDSRDNAKKKLVRVTKNELSFVEDTLRWIETETSDGLKYLITVNYNHPTEEHIAFEWLFEKNKFISKHLKTTDIPIKMLNEYYLKAAASGDICRQILKHVSSTFMQHNYPFYKFTQDGVKRISAVNWVRLGQQNLNTNNTTAAIRERQGNRYIDRLRNTINGVENLTTDRQQRTRVLNDVDLLALAERYATYVNRNTQTGVIDMTQVAQTMDNLIYYTGDPIEEYGRINHTRNIQQLIERTITTFQMINDLVAGVPAITLSFNDVHLVLHFADVVRIAPLIR